MTNDPIMNSIRVGAAGRRARSFAVHKVRQPKRRQQIRGKIIVICLLVIGFLIASGVTTLSIDSLASGLGARGGMSNGSTAASHARTPTSTPSSQWHRGEVPALYQIDRQWARTSYAESTLGESGCGPTCLAMAYIALTGKKDMDPIKMCAYAERGGFTEDGKTTWGFMTRGARGLGLKSNELPADVNIIANSVSSGNIVIATMGPGDFTTSGHFIVICGIDDAGQAIIRDPNSEANTKATWNLQRIIGQARNFWALSV